MLMQVAYTIPNDDYQSLNIMHKKWFRFKTLREEGVFDTEPRDGFLTMLQRERMIDDVFKILGFGVNNDA